jgi:hypothetical protein
MKCKYCNFQEDMDVTEETFDAVEEIHICDNCGARCIIERDLETKNEKSIKWWNPKSSIWE